LEKGLRTADLETQIPAVLILLGQGNMNPMNQVHVHMMYQAKDRLERANFAVLAGWVSPASDEKLQKVMQSNGPLLSSAFRVRAAETCCTGDDFVRVASWEAQQRGPVLDHIEVVAELQRAMNEKHGDTLKKCCRNENFVSKRTVKIFLVCCSTEASTVCKGFTQYEGWGTVVVPFGDSYILERPNMFQFLAEPINCNDRTTLMLNLLAAIKGGDTAYIKRVMPEAASSFLLNPTEAERKEFAADFEKIRATPLSEGPWPCEKLMQRLHAVKEDRKVVAVLVARGSINLTHRGHIQMLWQAKERLERAGYVVVSAWLSPSNEASVAQEAQRSGTEGLSRGFRLRVAELSVCDDDLVSVASWEVGQAESRSAREVLQAVREHLQRRFPGSLGDRATACFLACGSDYEQRQHFRQGLQPSDGLGLVVVPRNDDDVCLEAPMKLVFVADPAPSAFAKFSSTMVRTAIRNGNSAYATQAMKAAAARFIMTPTSREHLGMAADFGKLGVRLPQPPDLRDARDKLKGILSTWLGPKGTIHADELSKLLRLIDPSWSIEEMGVLMAKANTASDGCIVADDFVDLVFKAA